MSDQAQHGHSGDRSHHGGDGHGDHGHGDHGHGDHGHAGHGDGDHGHGEEHGMPHSTLGGYAAGFLLSVFLTFVPFALVMGHVFQSSITTTLVILALGGVQILVHMIFFLHMDGKVEGGWSMLALMFTVALVVITLSGSLWVMFHMNRNMMPTMHGMPHSQTMP